MDLREGKLSWFKLGPGGTLLGAMPMIGSAVALVPEETVSVFCSSRYLWFRLISFGAMSFDSKTVGGFVVDCVASTALTLCCFCGSGIFFSGEPIKSQKNTLGVKQ